MTSSQKSGGMSAKLRFSFTNQIIRRIIMKFKTLTAMLLSATLLLSTAQADSLDDLTGGTSETDLIIEDFTDFSDIDFSETLIDTELDEPEEETVITYTVTFDTGDGSTINGQIVNEDGLVETVTSPSLKGYTFVGWYADSDYTTVWNFSTDKVTEDTTIYAKWAEVTYRVTFQVNGGTSVSSQTVEEGAFVTVPTSPTRTGFTFDGWYGDSNFQAAWDFSTDIVEKNITIYAKWKEIAVSTTYGYLYTWDLQPVTDAEILLLQKGSIKYTGELEENGYFSFVNVVPGYYNLEITVDNTTRTELVKLDFNESQSFRDIMGKDFVMPVLSTSSVVSISSSTLVSGVGNMSTIADIFAGDEGNASVVMGKLRVMNYATDDNKALIQDAMAKNQFVMEYVEINAQKTVQNAWHDSDTLLVTEIDYPIEVVIELPSNYRDLTDYMVYRIHNGKVDILNFSPNSDGEYIALSENGRYFHIYTKKFSTYAVAFSDGDFYTPEREYSTTVNMTLNGDFTTSKSLGSISISDTSPKEDDVITIAVDTNSGFAVEEVIVVNSSKDKLTVTDNEDGTYEYTHGVGDVVITIAFTTTIDTSKPDSNDDTTSTTPDISYFTDVSVNDTFCSAINQVVSLGLMTGTGNGMFSPFDPVNRGTLVSMLYSLSGSGGNYQSATFSDVSSTDTYASAVAWAKYTNVIAGYSDNTFRPNQSVTREELATILYGFSDKYVADNSILPPTPLTYVDTSEISSWAKTAVTWASSNEIMTHRYNNYFTPWSVATRGEVAMALSGVLGIMEG